MGIHDYYAALLVRSQVEEALINVPAKHHSMVRDELTVIDDKFLRFTRIDGNSDLERFLSFTYNETTDDGWWWQRIPTSGPVCEELAAILARHQQNGTPGDAE